MELHLNQTGLIVHISSLLKLKTPVPRRRTEGHCIPIFVLLPNVVTLKEKKNTIPFLFHMGLDIKPGLLRLLKCKLLL